MRTLKKFVPPALLLAAIVAQACGEVPSDSSRTDRRLFQVKGVIRGAVTYTGLRPCSKNGHIVGSAVILVFDARNPPPPKGLANTAVNFGAVPGDALFANEPRNPGTDLYCPKDNGITDTILVSAPFTVSPMDDGQYVIQAFYDYTGDFLPTFKIRNLPEASDVIGGYIDTNDATKIDPVTMKQNIQNINYQPIFLPINIGYADPKSPSGFTIPDSGFVADNVAITLGVTTPLPRPYFYAKGAETQATGVAKGSSEMDPNYVPVFTMAQDFHVKAQPTAKIESNITEQQRSFVEIDLQAGLPAAELPSATSTTDPKLPFHFQIGKTPSLLTWADTTLKIPETSLIPQMWPLVVFAKLKDDRTVDPQNLVGQGSKTDPIVVIQGLTVFQDLLYHTIPLPIGPGPIPTSPADPAAATDHVHVLVRPSAICFNAQSPLTIQQGGLLVTPWKQGDNPNSSGMPEPQIDIINEADVINGAHGQIRRIQYACLPTGRYEINVVYPTGQAWTVPNEAGNCAVTEGSIQGDFTKPETLQCSAKTRPVLYSQGTRAILEITPATDPTHCQGMQAVPDECLPCSQRVNPGKFTECQ